MGNSLLYPALVPLLAARTVHCNSSTGSDTTGDGSSSRPWQTIAKAWADRLTYGELRAVYTAQLHGAGPYTMPVMGPSACNIGGAFVVLGDTASEIVSVSGTFTGDINTSTKVVGTSAGLGTPDTQKNLWLKITSGACVGVRCMVVSNTDTTITVNLTDWRSTIAAAIANGDTFSIVSPGTEIAVPAAVSGQALPGAEGWSGGLGYPNGAVTADSPLQHIFFNLLFTGANTLRFKNAAVCLVGCKFTTSNLQFYRCQVALGVLANANALGIGANAKTDLLTGCGIACTANFLAAGVSLVNATGCFSGGSLTVGSASLGDEFVWSGGRLDAPVAIQAGKMETLSGGITIVTKTITSALNGQLLLNGGTWTFAVTSGSCLLAKDFGSIIHTGSTISGGTTDAAGYGLQAISAGKILIVNKAPTLTGTAGADIKAENTAAIANSALSANGQSTLDAATQAIVMRVAA